MKVRLHARARMYFFFNDTATTEIYTLSLHDALPISYDVARPSRPVEAGGAAMSGLGPAPYLDVRSEEHTSELQSHLNLVCRLLLEKKNKTTPTPTQHQNMSMNAESLFITWQIASRSS